MISASRGINRTCPFCSSEFQPSRYHPDQRICASPDCQRRRRRDYHKSKLVNDPAYREQCRDSQKHWRDKNRGYMKRYRAQAEQGPRTAKSTLLDKLRSLHTRVKNNVAADVAHCNADVWLILRSGFGSVKNTLADAQLIVLASFTSVSAPLKKCKEQRFENDRGMAL
jgi:hypothetical protein